MQSPKNTTDVHILINAWCREFRNWSFYIGPAVYDEVLRIKMQQYETRLHLRLDFTAQGSEIFVPVAYRSSTGAHLFAGAAWERTIADNTINILSPERLTELATVSAATTAIAPLAATRDKIAPPAEAGWFYPEDLLCLQEDLPLLVSLISGMPGTLSMEAKTVRWFTLYATQLLQQIEKLTATGIPGCPVVLVQINEQGWPAGCKAAEESDYGDKRFPLHRVLSYFMPLIAAAGRHGLAAELTLIKAMYPQFKACAGAGAGTEGLLQQLLSQRNIECKGLLFAGKDYSVTYPNPLHKYFLLEPVLKPEGIQPIFERYFSKEDITVSIRSFDHDRDMELVYDWFHAEHAKPIWKMDWPMEQLELFFRTIAANDAAHSFIGEINGEPTFNLEVYWVTGDVLGEYYEVQPDDYGTHLLIAPVDKKKKFPSATMQTILDWLFAQPLIGRLVGEGSVDSVAALMNKVHVGFRLDRVLDMPHKRSHLNFCQREWYWERFPENKNFTPTAPTHKTTLHEPAASI